VTTVSYMFYEMSRSLSKNLSRALDCINMMDHFSVKVLIISSKAISDYAIRIIVANGYTVICETKMILRPYDSEKAGFYRKFDASVSSLRLIAFEYDKPVVRKKSIDWPDLDFTANLPTTHFGGKKKKSKTVEYSFAFVLLVPSLRESTSLFPSLSPHSGLVMLASRAGTGYAFEDLCARFSKSNSYRNAFPYNRIGFYNVDPCAAFTNVLVPRVLPKYVEIKEIAKGFHLTYDDVKEEMIDDVPVAQEKLDKVKNQPCVVPIVTPFTEMLDEFLSLALEEQLDMARSFYENSSESLFKEMIKIYDSGDITAMILDDGRFPAFLDLYNAKTVDVSDLEDADDVDETESPEVDEEKNEEKANFDLKIDSD